MPDDIVLAMGGLELDLGRHRVTVDGAEAMLSALELRLLAALMEAGGRVLTRDQLLDAIHGAGEGDVLDRSIDQYVRRLREKLGDDPAEPRYVATVRGAGYRAAMPVVRRAAAAMSAPRRAVRADPGRGAGRRRGRAGDRRRRRPAGRRGVVRGADDGRRRRARTTPARCSTRASRSCSGSRRWWPRWSPSSSRWPSPAASPGRWSGSPPPPARIADGDLDARVPEEGPAELRALAASYNAMAARLAQQEAVRREFIVNASHELRTPLTNLQGYLEALRDGVLPPDPATFDSLREEVDRLTRLAASLDVLAGAEGAAGRARDVDVGAIVAASADLVAPALARRSISLTRRRAGRVRRPRAPRRADAGARQPPPERDALHARRRPGARFGRRRRTTASGSGSPTRDRASRRPTCRGSGSASTGSRSRATANAAAPGSGSRSCASWSRPRAAASASAARAAGRRSG